MYVYRITSNYGLDVYFFLSSNFLSQALNKTGDYMRPVFITWSFESNFFGWWILMAADGACVTDLVDTVHYEMDSVVCSHNVYKSVWSPITDEQLVLEKEPARQCTLWICSGSDKGFSDSGTHSIGKFVHRSHVFYYTKRFCCPLSSICHNTGRRRKGKA